MQSGVSGNVGGCLGGAIVSIHVCSQRSCLAKEVALPKKFNLVVLATCLTNMPYTLQPGLSLCSAKGTKLVRNVTQRTVTVPECVIAKRKLHVNKVNVHDPGRFSCLRDMQCHSSYQSTDYLVSDLDQIVCELFYHVCGVAWLDCLWVVCDK